MDAVAIMTGDGSLPLIIVGVVFLLTLFGNMVSWSFGVNFVVVCAAKDRNMPTAFSTETRKSNMPKGVTIANGIIASIVVLLLPVAEAVRYRGLFLGAVLRGSRIPALQLHSHVPGLPETAAHRP